jgi:ABC-2 type transport system permease protein
MTAFWAVYRRDLLSLWATPVAGVLQVGFLLLQGAIFSSIVTHYSLLTELSVEAGPLEAYFGQQAVFLLITLLLLCPALTMRAFAEEKRSGTLEALLTAPVGAAAIVLGKFFATLTTYTLLWAPTLLYPLILRSTGFVDVGVLISSYLGLFLLGVAYLAVGILMSALSKSQLMALMLTVLVQFGLFILGLGAYLLEPGPLSALSEHISVLGHMEDFSRGVIDLRRVIFDLSLAGFALFMTKELVESWRSS